MSCAHAFGEACASCRPGPVTVAAVPTRQCGWCRQALEGRQREWCSKRCRQTAWRSRKIAVAEYLGDTPKAICYADPPYPGLSSKYYSDEPTYAGEVDHAELLSRLEGYDGWALSTSARSLRDILPMCPPEARVAPWVKPNGADPRTRGPHSLWEPVIYMPARLRRPGVRDYLSAKPARGGGTLMGRKPIAFCMWLFQLLGAGPADTLDDLYPGTGVVTSAWGQFVSPRGTGDVSPGADHDSSSVPGRDTSRGAGTDKSHAAAGDAARKACGCTLCRYPVEGVTSAGCRADAIEAALQTERQRVLSLADIYAAGASGSGRPGAAALPAELKAFRKAIFPDA